MIAALKIIRCGIYAIASLGKPERIYVGSSSNIDKRWGEHLYALRKGKHHSKKMQAHYNKYGKDDFVFSILSECRAVDLLIAEQASIDDLKPYFNSRPVAATQLGFKHSQETKDKISVLKKGTDHWSGRKHIQASKERMRLAKLGKKATAETSRILSFARRGNKNTVGNKNRLGIKTTPEAKSKISYKVKLRMAELGMRKRTIRIFGDSADLHFMKTASASGLVSGWTTNPSILRKAGVTNYLGFASEAARLVAPLPISFEVFADDSQGMIAQGKVLAALGKNVNVKIPIMNTKRERTGLAIKALADAGIEVNVTAVFSPDQAEYASGVLAGRPGYISVFAGRIADSGEDPADTIGAIRRRGINDKLIWASPREVFNVCQADACGCDVITLGPDLLAKLELAGKNLDEFSLETVRMFRRDAVAAGYQILDPNGYGVSAFG